MTITKQHSENAATPAVSPRARHCAGACAACSAADDSRGDTDRWPILIRASVMIAGGALCWAGLVQGAGRLIALVNR